MPDITVALSLLKKPIDDVWTLASGNVKEFIGKTRASANLKKIYQKLNATQKVKTIWNVDRAISLSSFYYPAKVRLESGIQAVSSLDDFPGNAIVLSGIVGQGKSILLRYLLGKEIRSGTRVPIFIELRRVSTVGIQSYVRSIFSELMDTKTCPEVFDSFASAGKISLLLDGFDEIDPDRMIEIGRDIDEFVAYFPNMRVVVTSRPGSGMESSPYFDVVQIAHLEEKDFDGFFRKILPGDKQMATSITRAIRLSSAQVKGLASTPLLATLMTIVYRAQQKIPTDFSEFYEELFQILLVRHDRSKQSYQRKRKTKLGDRDIQRAFEAFCFKCKTEKLSSVPHGKALELAAASIKALNLQADEGFFLEDISKVTCLLQDEGGRFEFLHQSVQDFFAARYVSTRPEAVAKQFYSTLVTSKNWIAWDQTLKFLAQIDRYRAAVNFFIPLIESLLRYLESLDKLAPAFRLRILISDLGGVQQNIDESDAKGTLNRRYSTYIEKPDAYFRLRGIYQRIFEVFFTYPAVALGKWRPCFDSVTNGQKVSYSQMASQIGIGGELDQCLRSEVEMLRNELVGFKESVRLYEGSKSFMGL